jgi:signal transduction histidine kinase
MAEPSFNNAALIDANLRRIALAGTFAPLVNVAHIVFFALDWDKDAATHLWRGGIIASHSVLLLLFATLGIAAWVLRRNGPTSRRAGQAVAHLFYVLVLLLGTAIALIDQLVTTALTPYLVVSLMVPLVAQLPPRGPVAYHALAFALLAGALPWVQADPNVRLSTMVNGLTGLGAGIFLNLLMWNFHRSRTLQDRRIEAQTAELVEMNRTRDRFFSIISHDLRSPFAGFIGLLEALRAQDSQISEDDRGQALDQLHKSSVSLYRLLENLLAWSKSQQNLIEVRPSEIDLAPFLHTVREPLEGLAAEKHLQVHLHCDPGLSLRSDPQILDTVLRNLLSNALKFTPLGGRVDLSVKAVDAERLEFECRDTGVGIPEATLKTLFELDRPGGLGLILCHDFVARLGGALHVESQPGGPTRFWFQLARS